MNQSSPRSTVSTRLVVGANLSTYRLSGTGSVGDGQPTTIDQWSNETTRFVRTASDTETNYRVVEGHGDRLTILASVERLLSAGEFQVANQTAGDGVVLTADSVSETGASTADAESFDGRLVVSESGQIRSVSVAVTRDGETVTASYELRQAGVETAPKPDWIDDVPPGATIQAQLSVDAAENSYLALTHSGGDTVPAATTVRVESNGTTDTVGLDSSLSAGDTRYLYFDASSQTLRVTADRPEQRAISPVTSPTSVRITTEAGVTLHSSSMAWGSESVSEDSSGGSTPAESANTTATAGSSQ